MCKPGLNAGLWHTWPSLGCNTFILNWLKRPRNLEQSVDFRATSSLRILIAVLSLQNGQTSRWFVSVKKIVLTFSLYACNSIRVWQEKRWLHSISAFGSITTLLDINSKAVMPWSIISSSWVVFQSFACIFILKGGFHSEQRRWKYFVKFFVAPLLCILCKCWHVAYNFISWWKMLMVLPTCQTW